MSNRTLIYGADGTPAVVDLGPLEAAQGALVEMFGMLIEYDERCGPAARPLTREEALNMIASIVGLPALEARWEGIELKATPKRADA